jgi:hypothetical protein
MAFSAGSSCGVTAWGLAVLLAASACSSEPVADDDGPAVEGAPVSNTATTCFEGTAPNFEEEVAPILSGGCVQGTHCHSALSYLPTPETNCLSGVALVDMALGAEGCPERSLADRLLDVPATQCFKLAPLVVPCHPERSYLITKLRGSADMCDGEPMPQDGELAPGALATLETWIRAGAPSAARPADACASACD